MCMLIPTFCPCVRFCTNVSLPFLVAIKPCVCVFSPWQVCIRVIFEGEKEFEQNMSLWGVSVSTQLTFITYIILRTKIDQSECREK